MDLSSQQVPHLNKGIGKLHPKGVSSSTHPQWKIENEDVSLPAACLILSHVKNNIDWMAKYANTFGVELCPHVKTSMCPRLIQMQMEAGAWGVTTATAHQTAVLHHFGVKRILMANQLVGKRNMEIITEIMSLDPEFEFFCLIDSVANAGHLASFFREKKQELNVLIEIGFLGGRTGVRSNGELLKILEATAAEGILLRGIEFYEGPLTTEEKVRDFSKKALETISLIQSNTDLLSSKKFIISGAGTAWVDIVAKEFYQADISAPREKTLLIRPGSYITHDKGIYEEVQHRIQGSCSAARSLGKLKPALKVLAYVQSRPEPSLAIIGLGRRDVATDSGFPAPSFICRKQAIVEAVCKTPTKGRWEVTPSHWEVQKIMDQHSFLRISKNDELHVGDIISFDISHPCNTFSVWRQILLVDESYTVLEVLPTYF